MHGDGRRIGIARIGYGDACRHAVRLGVLEALGQQLQPAQALPALAHRLGHLRTVQEIGAQQRFRLAERRAEASSGLATTVRLSPRIGASRPTSSALA